MHCACNETAEQNNMVARQVRLALIAPVVIGRLTGNLLSILLQKHYQDKSESYVSKQL